MEEVLVPYEAAVKRRCVYRFEDVKTKVRTSDADENSLRYLCTEDWHEAHPPKKLEGRWGAKDRRHADHLCSASAHAITRKQIQLAFPSHADGSRSYSI